MQFKDRHIIRSLYIFALAMSTMLLTACDINDDVEECQYNTRLIYQYDREYTASTNVLSQYVQSLDEYIFDANGVLVQINKLPGYSCFGKYVSETNLPEGKYSVITWGNMGDFSKVNQAQIGVTKREDMLLNLDNAYSPLRATAYQSNSEKLYYAYRTFSVEKYGVSKVEVDMSHSHCVLDITVRWKKAEETPASGNYYMLLKQLPTQYAFMPEYKFKDKHVAIHKPEEDEFPKDTDETLYFITTVYGSQQLKTYRQDVVMNGGRLLNTQFVSYRYRSNSHELLSIYAADGTQVMKEIDLYRFFRDMDIELDTNLRQEFQINIEIDGNTVIVSLVEVGDWDEGGTIGG